MRPVRLVRVSVFAVAKVFRAKPQFSAMERLLAHHCPDHHAACLSAPHVELEPQEPAAQARAAGDEGGADEGGGAAEGGRAQRAAVFGDVREFYNAKFIKRVEGFVKQLSKQRDTLLAGLMPGAAATAAAGGPVMPVPASAPCMGSPRRPIATSATAAAAPSAADVSFGPIAGAAPHLQQQQQQEEEGEVITFAGFGLPRAQAEGAKLPSLEEQPLQDRVVPEHQQLYGQQQQQEEEQWPQEEEGGGEYDYGRPAQLPRSPLQLQMLQRRGGAGRSGAAAALPAASAVLPGAGGAGAGAVPVSLFCATGAHAGKAAVLRPRRFDINVAGAADVTTASPAVTAAAKPVAGAPAAAAGKRAPWPTPGEGADPTPGLTPASKGAEGAAAAGTAAENLGPAGGAAADTMLGTSAAAGGGQAFGVPGAVSGALPRPASGRAGTLRRAQQSGAAERQRHYR